MEDVSAGDVGAKSNFDALVPTDLRVFFAGVADPSLSDIGEVDRLPEAPMPIPLVGIRFLGGVDVVAEVVVEGVLRRFAELEDFKGGVAFPVEKTGDIAGVDDAVALLLDGVDFAPAAAAPPPPALRASCHAFARALASARASFLLFFDVELSSAPPSPPANEVSAFRLGMLLSYFCLSLANFMVRSIDFAFAAFFVFLESLVVLMVHENGHRNNNTGSQRHKEGPLSPKTLKHLRTWTY